MTMLKKTFRLLTLGKEDADPAAQTAAVVSAYQAKLAEFELEMPESGFTLYTLADNDGDSEPGDAQVLYCVSDRYATWYVLATGATADVIAFYAYVYDGWSDEEAFAYSEDLDALMKSAGEPPVDKTERDAWFVKAFSGDVATTVEKRGYVPIAKSDTQQYTLGVAYPHSEVDSHGDFTDEDELEQAAWNFMRSVVAKGEGGVGTDHADGTDDAAQVVESYIYRGPEWTVDLGEDETVVVKSGDWMVGAIWTDEAWERIEKDEITGWSIQGLAILDDEAEPPEAD
jgi:hypothetical protein